MIDWGNGEIEINATKGKCSKCGKCCGLFIPVTKKEVDIIKKYVTDNDIQPENRIRGNSLELRCPFLDLDKHICKIYPVRPYVCRDFICSRKDWKKHRSRYQLRANYNGVVNGRITKKGMYSMDELIYNDISLHVRAIIEESKNELGNATKEKFMAILKFINRLDLLDKLEIEYKED